MPKLSEEAIPSLQQNCDVFPGNGPPGTSGPTEEDFAFSFLYMSSTLALCGVVRKILNLPYARKV